MVVPPARYVVDFSPTAYAYEPIPDEAPVYPVGITATAQRLLYNNFARAMRIYRYKSGSHTALKKQLHPKYNPEYWIRVVQPDTGVHTYPLVISLQSLYPAVPPLSSIQDCIFDVTDS